MEVYLYTFFDLTLHPCDVFCFRPARFIKWDKFLGPLGAPERICTLQRKEISTPCLAIKPPFTSRYAYTVVQAR